ncbi:hypothetical protein [Streptomyces sp. PTD5-9]|uniref:hypothetical protein n=1 Tax=Streptomyces sp. PTD5-9 TaxID=3120150 RepID=UPI003008443D
MVADVGTPLDEEQRLVWSYTPLEGVGPLRFGMTPDQARAAVDGVLEADATRRRAGDEEWTEFWLRHRPHVGFYGAAVTAYFSRSAGLAGIALDALRGPQAIWEGTRLVGRAPSPLEAWFTDRLAAREAGARYSMCADPCSTRHGLVLRVQRTGVGPLSRPVMVAETWADGCWDVIGGGIPRREWRIPGR